jgi:hypothetical protein
MSGFKNFIMRGNLVELAVAVVIGTQFSNLVKQFTSSFVNPLISLAGGTPDRGADLPDLGPGGLLRHGAAGQPPAEAVRAEPGRHHQGLPGVHDEHPDRRHPLPGMHRADHARHRTASAGRTAPVAFTVRMAGKPFRITIQID